MTANELVVYLEDITDSEESPYRQAATMLRQQQAEIDRLTMLCDCMTTESNRKGNEIEALKLRELTDEKIKEVYGEYFDVKNFDWLQLQCIQAILRKASEK